MRVLVLSCGDFEYDGRLRALIDACLEIGEVTVISRGAGAPGQHHYFVNGSYLDYIRQTARICRQLEDFDVLLLDNRRSVIPGFIARRLLKPDVTILDCRELYLFNSVSNVSGKIGCLVEQFGMRGADQIICANQERADYSWKRYKLKRPPVVFENYRQLQFTESCDMAELQERFSDLIAEDEIRIVSTAGCDLSRLTAQLVRDMKRVKGASRLILVGDSSEADKKHIRTIVKDEGLDNVSIIGRLDQNELKFLIDSCHIGVVSYHQRDLNNTYCSSGKLYEYLYEGLPVVTSTNPPLAKVCESGVGEADDDFSKAINKILAKYNDYCLNVDKFTSQHPAKKALTEFAQVLSERITQIQRTKIGGARAD
ncbi:MAG: glycosyltransferase [Adlercreutzia sp.]|nr:glycosyltransferase [Adlercreutzia sp.]